jgi:hypothetical protein
MFCKLLTFPLVFRKPTKRNIRGTKGHLILEDNFLGFISHKVSYKLKICRAMEQAGDDVEIYRQNILFNLHVSFSVSSISKMVNTAS